MLFLKKTVGLLAGIMMMSGSFASAHIATEEIALGGIPAGVSFEYMKSVYGEPEGNTEKGSEYQYRYGDSVFLFVLGNKVMSIKTTANNGFATPAGIAVGMNISAAEKAYGKADYSAKNHKNPNASEMMYRFSHIVGAHYSRGRLIKDVDYSLIIITDSKTGTIKSITTWENIGDD